MNLYDICLNYILIDCAARVAAQTDGTSLLLLNSVTSGQFLTLLKNVERLYISEVTSTHATTNHYVSGQIEHLGNVRQSDYVFCKNLSLIFSNRFWTNRNISTTECFNSVLHFDNIQ